MPPLNFSKTAFWLSGWWGHSGLRRTLRRMPRGKQDKERKDEEEKDKAKPPAKCGGGCGKIVADTDNGLQCEVCEKWFHCKCIEVSEEAYKVISDTDALHWYCKACNVSVEKSLAKIKAKVDILEEEMKAIKDSNASLKQEMSKQAEEVKMIKDSAASLRSELNKQSAQFDQSLVGIRDEIISIKKQQAEQNSPAAQETKWTSIVSAQVKKEIGGVDNELKVVKKVLAETREQAAEEKQKEVRRNNIIIYRAKESTDESTEARYKFDKDFCFKLVSEVLEIDCEAAEIKRVVRLGKREEGENRPLLLEFRSNVTKNRVMESLSKLREAPDNYKNLSVVHDMTKTERQACKHLVEEAKTKQQDDTTGEWLYRVRGNPGNWRIVKLRRE